MPTPGSPLKSALLPIGGAALAVVLAVGISIGFLRWRSSAQRLVLDRYGAACRGGERKSCDELRGACLKRSGDACVTLADTYLSRGAGYDAEEGARLLGDACTFQHAHACVRLARMRLEGQGIPKDAAAAKTLLDRACFLGAHEGCALRQTAP